jgi:DNA-binding response OmpR family regulator
MGTILIIDDETAYAFALCEILRADGFEAHWASGAKQALEYLQELTPDLLIVDVVMPEISGLSLIRMLREQAAWSQIPIIVISARAMLDDRAAALTAGADAFLSKPFSRKDLHSAIRPFFPAISPTAPLPAAFTDAA